MDIFIGCFINIDIFWQNKTLDKKTRLTDAYIGLLLCSTHLHNIQLHKAGW